MRQGGAPAGGVMQSKAKSRTGRARVATAVAAISAIAAGSALTGCGSDYNDVNGPTIPTSPRTGVVVRVVAQDNLFRARQTTVAVGDTVRFENVGRNDHDVLPKDGGTWGVDADAFVPGDVYEHVFDEPGVYEFYCSIHGTNSAGMVGTVTVTG
ncbi:MAG: plastocyanin/azurin family copper-binding protein [Ilumatobacteraceae bacterium]